MTSINLSFFLQKIIIRLRTSSLLAIYLFSFVGFLEFWHWRLVGHCSLASMGMFAVIGGLSLIYGRLFFQITPLSSEINRSYSIQLLVGFFILNTSLFFLTLTTSLGVATNFGILACSGLVLSFIFPRAITQDPLNDKDHWPDFLCLFLCGFATTLWCTDILSLPLNNGQQTIFPVWQDGFIHTRFISSFAQSHGMKTLSDILMDGAPAASYHYAAYIMSAAVSLMAKTTAYEVFASFLLPLGLLLSGLAAFALASALWGTWPGVAATVAILLLPDAYQQGFHNKFLSYNLVQQVGPAGLYGTACVAIAWMFILYACRSGKRKMIGWGYAFLMMALCYKAHLFVANAFLIMIYPCLFFPKIRLQWRVLLAVALTTLFVTVVIISQKSPSIPVLKLDGSAMHGYAQMLLGSTNPGLLRSFLKTFFQPKLIIHPLPMPVFGILLAIMIMMFTFGLWSLLWIAATFFLYRKEKAAVWMFPILIIINYLTMSLGLAFDTKKIGMPEELVHRPFVWAYFAVVVWTSAAVYFLLFGNASPKKLQPRIIASLFVVASIGTPFFFAHEIQTMPLWGLTSASTAIPTELVTIANIIRQNSNVSDTIQNSKEDIKLATTALAERQCYVIKALKGCRLPQGLNNRLDEVNAFEKMTTEEELYSFLNTHHLSWYILYPETQVAWPASFQNSFAFQVGGYRVYHWKNQVRQHEQAP